VQPAEQQARAAYTALITGFPELPLAAEARFELAELHAQRAEHDAAIKLLGEAIDQEPSAELTERLRLRLGASLLAKGDAQAAFEQFDTVTANPQSPLAPAAHYRAGECLLALKDPAKAAARLAVFRDQGPFQNLPGVSDRALLCLGQALTQAKQHDPARQAYETLWSRFPNSPWTAEARYGAGWALQLQGRHDEAVNQYQAVVAATASELGAKAQLQIGLCRTEQKRYPEAVAALLIIPFTYDDAALASLAMLEAARALGENQQTEAAVKLLQKLVEQYPESESAAAARQRLEALQTKTGGGS
jgi:TolA-binding protein